VVPTVLAADDADGVDGLQARFNMYCVKCARLNVTAVLLAFVCITQIENETEKSTAMHLDICKHRVRQSVSDVSLTHFPPSDITPSFRLHVSHSVKHTHVNYMKRYNTLLYLLRSLCVFNFIDFILSHNRFTLIVSIVCKHGVTIDQKYRFRYTRFRLLFSYI